MTRAFLSAFWDAHPALQTGTWIVCGLTLAVFIILALGVLTTGRRKERRELAEIREWEKKGWFFEAVRNEGVERD